MFDRRNLVIALVVALVVLGGVFVLLPDDDPDEPWAECSTDESAPTPDPLPIALDEVADLGNVTGAAAHPDGAVWSTSKDGLVHRTVAGASAPMLDLTADVVDDGYEQGLLDLAFGPGAQHLYLSYTGAEDALFVVEVAVADDGTLDVGPPRTLLEIEQPTNEHNGGGLVIGPDGMLWISVGDGGEGPTDDGITVSDYAHQRSQDRASLYGSILRIDPRGGDEGPYGIPADNPLVDVEGARPEIWAHGLRNPWRFAVDDQTGDVWIGDVGQFCTEEVDYVADGVGRATSPNFGWPMYEADRAFLVDEFGDVPDHVPPLFSIEHATGACSVVGGVVYRGEAFPDLQGFFTFADSCDDKLRFIRPLGERYELVVVPVALSQIVSIDEDADGELLLASLEAGIHRVVPAA